MFHHRGSFHSIVTESYQNFLHYMGYKKLLVLVVLCSYNNQPLKKYNRLYKLLSGYTSIFSIIYLFYSGYFSRNSVGILGLTLYTA